MGCCGDNDKKENVIMSSDKVPAFYEHKNIGKHMVVGSSTRTKYGYIGGGRLVPDGVHKNDIRIRPDLFSCGNCRGPFTVTATDVFCPNCSSGQLESLQVGRPVSKRPPKEYIEYPTEVPPPPPIEEFDVVSEYNYLVDLDFGGTRKEHYLNLLKENGIETVEDAQEVGKETLLSISGIGEKTVEAILGES